MNTQTKQRIDRILKLCPPGLHQMQISFELEAILREQDRDTRHACAEAILEIGSNDALAGDSARFILNAFKATAHQAVMNTSAI